MALATDFYVYLADTAKGPTGIENSPKEFSNKLNRELSLPGCWEVGVASLFHKNKKQSARLRRSLQKCGKISLFSTPIDDLKQKIRVNGPIDFSIYSDIYQTILSIQDAVRYFDMGENALLWIDNEIIHKIKSKKENDKEYLYYVQFDEDTKKLLNFDIKEEHLKSLVPIKDHEKEYTTVLSSSEYDEKLKIYQELPKTVAFNLTAFTNEGKKVYSEQHGQFQLGFSYEDTFRMFIECLQKFNVYDAIQIERNRIRIKPWKSQALFNGKPSNFTVEPIFEENFIRTFLAAKGKYIESGRICYDFKDDFVQSVRQFQESNFKFGWLSAIHGKNELRVRDGPFSVQIYDDQRKTMNEIKAFVDSIISPQLYWFNDTESGLLTKSDANGYLTFLVPSKNIWLISGWERSQKVLDSLKMEKGSMKARHLTKEVYSKLFHKLQYETRIDTIDDILSIELSDEMQRAAAEKFAPLDDINVGQTITCRRVEAPVLVTKAAEADDEKFDGYAYVSTDIVRGSLVGEAVQRVLCVFPTKNEDLEPKNIDYQPLRVSRLSDIRIKIRTIPEVEFDPGAVVLVKLHFRCKG